jgi:hypothetical protein
MQLAHGVDWVRHETAHHPVYLATRLPARKGSHMKRPTPQRRLNLVAAPAGTLLTSSNAALVDAACRADLASFVGKCFHQLMPGRVYLRNWHIQTIAYYLEMVRRGKIKRLIINAPRGLKSLITSVSFPAFVLGHDPSRHIIGVSYGADLAVKLGNDFRAIVDSDWYRRLFPWMQVSRVKNTELEVLTSRYGYPLGTSIDGTLTGRGGDIIIIDDPLKPSDALSASPFIVFRSSQPGENNAENSSSERPSFRVADHR